MTTRVRLITVEGRTRPLSEWEREVNGSRHVVGERLRRGWSVERATTTPVTPRGATPMGALGELCARMFAWDGSASEAAEQVATARRLVRALAARAKRARRAEQMEAAE